MPLAADFGPGPEAAAGRGVCFLRLPPSTSGLARRGRRQGAQLEIFLSTPRVADFGPGPGGGRQRGAQLDGEFAVYASRRQLRALPGWGGGGARCLGLEFCFSIFHSLASRCEAQLCLVTGPNTI